MFFYNIAVCMQNSFIIICILSILGSGLSQQLHHLTSSTNCTITFTTDTNNSTTPNMKFLTCTRNTCLRNLVNGNCANLQTFKFQQQKCYRECCHADIFDFVKCEEFNRKRQITQKSAENKLSIIFILVFFGLLIAVIVFSVAYLNCCQNFDNIHMRVREDQFHWKQCKFNQSQVCQVCKGEGAFLMISCGSFYHLKCLNTNQTWICIDCDKKIKKIKIFCPVCESKSIVLEANSFEQLDRKVLQLYQFHPQKCLQSMGNQMDTQRKFTQSTKE